MPFFMTLIGGNLSESIFACNSKLDVLIKDSVAIALVIPDDGNPLTNVYLLPNLLVRSL